MNCHKTREIMPMKVSNVMFMLPLLMLTFATQLSAKEVFVEIYKKKFIPAEISIELGDTVVWKNIEKRQYHSVWFKSLVAEEPNYFFPDESYQMTFASKGEFSYICGPHPKMTGLVIVK